MPVKTNLNRNPYFNDFSPEKEYYELLFKPSLSVQVRELNSLQSYLQNQIERFGDNIFKSGTIVAGCNFTYYPNYKYIKILDNNVDGVPIEASLYKGYRAWTASGLYAYITNYEDGFEATDPNLKTLYVTYQSSSNTGATTFAAGDILTIDNGKASIFGVEIADGGTAFSNSDAIVFSPSLELLTTTGTFANGEYLNDPIYGSNAQIIGITTISGNVAIYKIKPLTDDLANSQVNSLAWTFGERNTVYNSGNTAAGVVTRVHGANASAKIVTNGIGKITSIVMTNIGGGYYGNTFVTVKSANNSAGIDALDLVPVKYFDKIEVAATANSVGEGYAFGVSDGVIYQSGHFLKVNNQIVIVNNYSTNPNNVCVGFNTEETIVSYLADSSLRDNALGTENETAPGADRLKLTPQLEIQNTGDALSNNQFCILAYWNDGQPFKQTPHTVYSKIGDEMARRTVDTSGNFVLDPFLVTTVSTANQELEGSYYTTVIDPGEAYIAGYKTKTLRNYKINVPKATETKTTSNKNITLNYDAYVRVNEVGGLFQFSTAANVEFWDTAKDFLSNASLITTGNTTPQGTQIGSARMRSMVLENGYAGDASAVYRIHLFDIQMNVGKSFRDIKSLYFDGASYKGICDVVLEQDATTGSNVAVLHGAKNDTLVFKSGTESIRNTNNTTYIYRTIDQTTSTANTGLLTKSVAGNPDEFYPYSSTLSDADMSDLYVVPVGNDLVAYTAHTGTISCNDTSTDVVGSSTTFINDLEVGDYVRIGNDSVNEIKQVRNIVNNTYLSLDSNCSFSNTGGSTWRAFPQYAPVPFGSREGLTANLNVTNNILTLDFGMTFEGSVTVNTALGVSIKVTGGTSVAKTANRERYVKLRLANNSTTNAGPWSLGVADVFRLRSVHIGNSTVNTTAFPDIKSEFYINHGHKANYLDLASLSLKPKSSTTLSTDDYLLVCFDYYTRADDGYFDTVSYLGTANAADIAVLDSYPLANLSSAGCSWEVPEFFDARGNYYDLLNCLDFRPAAANTVTVGATWDVAPVNPEYSLSFGNTADPANDKKFPLPDSSFLTTIEEYMGRTDIAVVGTDGLVTVQKGTASVTKSDRKAPTVSPGLISLNKIVVPPYPNITVNLSNNVLDIIDTGVHSEGRIGTRLPNHVVKPLVANSITSVPTQPKGYSMADIGNLERRIRDLEYYQNLTLLETSITNKIIPSSIDGTLNRFKFGFVADDFSTRIYSDTSDPQYAAEIEVKDNLEDTVFKLPTKSTNFCTPPKYRWGAQHGLAIVCPYIEEEVIYQPHATDSRDAIHPGCIATSTVETSFVTNTITTYVTTNTVVNVVSNVVVTAVDQVNTFSFASWIARSQSTGYVSSSNYTGGFSKDANYTNLGSISTPQYLGFADFKNQTTVNQLALQSEASMQMSSQSGNVTCWFHFIQCPAIRVYQSHSPLDNPTLRATPYRNQSQWQFTDKSSLYRKVIDTASAVPMTNTDVSYLRSNNDSLAFWNIATNQGWTSIEGYNYRGQPLGYNALVNRLIKYGGEWIGGSGKLTFTHDPAYGRYYYFDVSLDAGPRSATYWIQYFAMIEYPIDETVTSVQTVVNQVVNSVTTPVTTTVTERVDTLIIDPCGETGAPGAYTGIGYASYASGGVVVPDGTTRFDTIVVSASGLVPFTEHTLYVNGSEANVNVKPLGGEFGDPLVTDPTGQLVLEYYLPLTNWAEKTSELGLTKTSSGSSLIFNEGDYDISEGYTSFDYQLFEVLAPNSRAGAKLPYVPWTAFS